MIIRMMYSGQVVFCFQYVCLKTGLDFRLLNILRRTAYINDERIVPNENNFEVKATGEILGFPLTPFQHQGAPGIAVDAADDLKASGLIGGADLAFLAAQKAR